MTGDEANPVTVSKDGFANGDLGIELNNKLDITLEARNESVRELEFQTNLRSRRLRNRRATSDKTRIGSKAVHHSIEITLLRGFHSWCRCAILSKLEDGALRIVFLHSVEIVGTLQQVLSLTAGVLCAYRLTVDALCRQALLQY